MTNKLNIESGLFFIFYFSYLFILLNLQSLVSDPHTVMVLCMSSLSLLLCFHYELSLKVARGTRLPPPFDQNVQKIGNFKLETTNLTPIRNKKVQIIRLCPPPPPSLFFHLRPLCQKLATAL